MTNLRRVLLTTSLAAAGSGVASANEISYLSAPTTQGSGTSFAYSLSLPKFNLPGDTLTGARLYFYGAETVSTLVLTNTGTGSETFTFTLSDNITDNSSDSAHNANRFSGETLALFSQSMTLGGPSAPPCPENTPSASCSSVAFTPPDFTANNLDLGFPTGIGDLGLEGVVESISGADLANYTGSGDFTLGGSTPDSFEINPSTNDISPTIAATVEVSAEIDYTYTVPTTPEPGTTGLMGSALLGLGWFVRRFKKN